MESRAKKKKESENGKEEEKNHKIREQVHKFNIQIKGIPKNYDIENEGSKLLKKHFK